MIIHKTNKTYQTRSKYPNSNWTGHDGYYVVDDASELAQRIKDNYPYFEFVLDSQGALIAITPTERPPEPEPEPTTEEDLMSMAVDHEYRLTLLELGVI